MGEGDPTLLDPAFGLPSRARKGPLCVSARGRHACWGRPCYAPWAKLGASQATLPDYMSTCQLAAFSKPSSLAADYGESERRAFKMIFLRVAISCNLTSTCVNAVF